MKNKRLYTLLMLNQATDMMNVFLSRLSFNSTIGLGNHLNLITKNISNAK